MDFQKADQRIRKIKSIKIGFPAPSAGEGVSRQTGQTSAEPEPVPGITIDIEVPGEMGSFVVEGQDAATIYGIIRDRLAD